MEALKLEILIVNHDKVDHEEIKEIIENARYPNRCISPCVMSIESRDIGEWKDDHPLNYIDKMKSTFNKLFGKKN